MKHSLPAFAAVLALGGTASAQYVMMTNATTDTLVAFSPIDGSLVNAALFPIPNTVCVSAIDVNDEIWISEQTGDRVVRYDATGVQLGVIGPTFAGGGLDNIRGMAYVNGIVYVTNSGTANGSFGSAVATFDPAGNFLGQFTTNTLASSPFSVMPFQGDLLVAGSGNANDVYRFTSAGAPVSVFHNSTLNFAHQIAPASDGNVWLGVFTTGVVAKLDATTGTALSQFTAAGARGVFELANGNILWSNGTGAWVYDIVAMTSTQVMAGSCYHLNLYTPSVGMASATPYGTGCDGLTLATAGLPQIGNAGFALVANNVPAVSPIGMFAFGSAAVNPGVDLTVIGMPGCFGYTSFDLGLYTGSLVASGSSSFGLPIPNNPALVGAALASQGVSFSLLTPFGLASSNGMQLVLGN